MNESPPHKEGLERIDKGSRPSDRDEEKVGFFQPPLSFLFWEEFV